MEPLRIEATASGETVAYDAQTLFSEALRHQNSGECTRAVALYDQLADRFPESRYRSPGLYNAGVCLRDAGALREAAARFDRY